MFKFFTYIRLIFTALLLSLTIEQSLAAHFVERDVPSNTDYDNGSTAVFNHTRLIDVTNNTGSIILANGTMMLPGTSTHNGVHIPGTGFIFLDQRDFGADRHECYIHIPFGLVGENKMTIKILNYDFTEESLSFDIHGYTEFTHYEMGKHYNAGHTRYDCKWKEGKASFNDYYFISFKDSDVYLYPGFFYRLENLKNDELSFTSNRISMTLKLHTEDHGRESRYELIIDESLSNYDNGDPYDKQITVVDKPVDILTPERNT